MILTITTILSFSSVAKVDPQKAETFIQTVTTEGIEEIVNSNVTQKEKNARFKKLFNNALDVNFIGKFVLGRYWRNASPYQRKNFITTFRKFNIKNWSKHFDLIKGKSFTFYGTSPSSSKNQIFVNSKVPMDDKGKPVTVVWRVRQKDNTLKIVDIIIENVSLAITARNEYTAFINNSPTGIDGLIDNLKSKL